MSDRPDVPRIETVESRLSRRELIKRGLALGTVGYVAPMIVGSATKVSAQGVSGLGCGDTLALCDEEDPSGVCDEEIPCFCVALAGGGTACLNPTVLDDLDEDECPADFFGCPNGNSDCDDDWFCVDIESEPTCEAETCDGEPIDNFCLPLCSLVLPTLTVAASPRTRKPWRGFKFLR